MGVIYVCEQSDKSFSVYLGWDSDPNGAKDALFSWGTIDGRRIAKADAKNEALCYALELKKQYPSFAIEHTKT